MTGLHWVVLTASPTNEPRDADALLTIADSLVQEPRTEPLGAYLNGRVHSLLLVRPRATPINP